MSTRDRIIIGLQVVNAAVIVAGAALFGTVGFAVTAAISTAASVGIIIGTTLSRGR